MVRSLPIPDDWDEETDGYETAIFCFPNSPDWKATIRGMFFGMAYGPIWDEKTGSIKETQDIFLEMEDSLSMACNAELDRIATAIEAMNDKATEALEYVDSQYISVSEFINFLELAGLEELTPWIDALGELVEIIGLIPDFNLQLTPANMVQMLNGFFLRRDFKAKMDDIVLMLEANAVGQFGPSLPLLIDEVAGSIPGGELVDNVLGTLDETILGISEDFLTAITGNYVTNRLDDIRNSINGGSIIPGNNVTNRLAQLKDQVALLELAVTVQSTGGANCGCFEVGPDEETPTDEIIIDDGDPPETHENWEAYSQDKCNYANKITDELIGLLSASATLAGVPGLVAVGSIVAAIVLLVTAPASAFVLVGAALVAGTFAITVYSAIAYMLISYATELGNWVTELESTQEAIICDLYDATTTGAAKTILIDWLNNSAAAVDADSTWLGHVATFAANIINNNLLNGLIEAYPPLEGYIGSFDCAECEEELSPCDWMIAPVALVQATNGGGAIVFTGDAGDGTILNDGTSFSIDAVPCTISGVANHILCLCTKEFYDRWVELSALPSGSQPTLTCDLTEGSANKRLRLDGSLPGLSHRWYNLNAGSIATGSSSTFSTNPHAGLQLVRLHRSDASGGNWTSNFTVLQPS